MKKQMAILMALAICVSLMAAAAEEQAAEETQTETVQQETVEETQAEGVQQETVEATWVEPFEDGDWLSIPEMSAEVYLPAGWTLTSAAADTFTAADADNTETLAVTLEDFDQTDLTAYMDAFGETYEMVQMADRDAAVITTDVDKTLVFLYDEDTLVRMTFAPADEEGVAGSAVAVAETFWMSDAQADATETTADAEAADAGADDAETDAAASEANDAADDAEATGSEADAAATDAE